MTIEAADIVEVEHSLRARGYQTIAISEIANQFHRLRPFLQRRQQFPLLMFCEELRALTRAGLSLIEAIDALHRRPSSPLVGHVIGTLSALLREGRSLSAAMSSLPRLFPELLVATIRSSEETGELGTALNRYIEYRKQLDGLRDKLVSASVYPILLLVVGSLVVLFLLGYVVPRFSKVFEGLGDNLP